MIKVRALLDGQRVEDVAMADLPATRARQGTLVWVEAISPSPEELATLGEEFGIHEIALKDLQVSERQRPKVEQYQAQILLVAYGALTGTGENRTRVFEVDLVAGPNYLLTVHGGAPVDEGPVANRVKARPELAREGAGYLLYVALDELVETFFPALDAIGQRVVDLEEAVLAGDTGIQARMASNRVNTVARNLAAYAAIFAVVTMISGIYGMNFQHMPELGWRFGYGWALGLMVVGAGGLYIYFKRKGWL